MEVSVKLIYYSCKNLNIDGRPNCKDLLLGNTNNKCYNNDVRVTRIDLDSS